MAKGEASGPSPTGPMPPGVPSGVPSGRTGTGQPAPGLAPADWPELVAAFTAAYGCRPVEVRPVASAYHHPAALQLIWPGGAVCVKPFLQGPAQLSRVEGYLQRLATARPRCWVAGCPRPGGGFSFWHRGRPFLVTWWEPGTPCRPAPEPASGAARALAVFHQAGSGLAPWRPDRSWPRRWHRLLAATRAGLDRLRRAALRGAPGLTGTLERAVLPMLTTGQQALSFLSRSPDYARLEQESRRRGQLCHRDLTPPNLLCTPGGQILLLDPDRWGPDLRLADLCALAGPVSGFSAPTALGALAAYTAAAGPLTPGEARLLPWSLRLPRELWWACQDPDPDPAELPERLAAVMDAWHRRVDLARTLERELDTKKTPG